MEPYLLERLPSFVSPSFYFSVSTNKFSQQVKKNSILSIYIIETSNTSTFKPAQEAISIKQSPVLKGHPFPVPP
jgi:hypothetical protein